MTSTERAHEYLVIYKVTTYKYQFLTKAKDSGFDEAEAELAWRIITEARNI